MENIQTRPSSENTVTHDKETEALDRGANQSLGTSEQTSQRTSQEVCRGPDLLDHFEVVTDEDAAPVDWDDALADFLIAYAEQETTTSSVTPSSAVAEARPLPRDTMAAKMSEPPGYLSQPQTPPPPVQPC